MTLQFAVSSRPSTTMTSSTWRMSTTTLATILLFVLPSFGTSLPVSYECPGDDANAEDAKNKTRSWNTWADFGSLHEEILTNMTEYLKTFRDSEFDANSFTYNEYKDAMRPFKSRYFSKHLQGKENPTLYESAHGVGMNLLMTLEILEEQGIEGVNVYGNEYVDASTIKARHVLDSLPVANSSRGMICTADSTDLSFVPEEAFDVVYTGYISPIINPLGFTSPSQDENYASYRKLCQATEDDREKIQLRDTAQRIQNDWYGKWVGEMVRIAKPGAAVVIEQASVPYCDCYIDWGGVPQSFWKEAVEKNTYGWNIDPDSLVIELDTMYVKRYHVAMVKKQGFVGEDEISGM